MCLKVPILTVPSFFFLSWILTPYPLLFCSQVGKFRHAGKALAHTFCQQRTPILVSGEERSKTLFSIHQASPGRKTEMQSVWTCSTWTQYLHLKGLSQNQTPIYPSLLSIFCDKHHHQKLLREVKGSFGLKIMVHDSGKLRRNLEEGTEVETTEEHRRLPRSPWRTPLDLL